MIADIQEAPSSGSTGSLTFGEEIVPGLGWTASTQHGLHRNRQVARMRWLIDRGAASETHKQATTDAKRPVGARVRRVGGRYSLDVVAS